MPLKDSSNKGGLKPYNAINYFNMGQLLMRFIDGFDIGFNLHVEEAGHLGDLGDEFDFCMHPRPHAGLPGPGGSSNIRCEGVNNGVFIHIQPRAFHEAKANDALPYVIGHLGRYFYFLPSVFNHHHPIVYNFSTPDVSRTYP